MKYLKMLGLAAVAAMAVMAFVGANTASASVICSTTTTPCSSPWANGTVTDLSLVGTAETLETSSPGGSGRVLYTCTAGTMRGTLTNGTGTATGSVSVPSTGTVWGATGTACTATTDTIAGGTLEIHNIAGTSNGTVTASGFKVTVNTVFFGTCVFKTGTGLDLGEITEGKSAGNTPDATLNINVTITRESGLCPLSVVWKATYVLTEPANTTLSVSAS